MGRRGARRPSGSAPCPCGLGPAYPDCCGRLHAGPGYAATAEQLMRSRYSAFAVEDEAHLLRTWHPRTRPARVPFDPGQRWTGLEIIATSGGGPLDSTGSVEFRATHSRGAGPEVLHEDSHFVRMDGAWFYLGPVAPGRESGAAGAAGQ